MKKTLIAALLSLCTLNACNENDAQVASANLSQAADNFQIIRRIVFYNTNTDTYPLEIIGACSIGKGDSVDREITVTCKTGPNEYKKHFLALSDDLTFFSEQIDAAQVNVYRYNVVFKPSVILPVVEIKTQPTP